MCACFSGRTRTWSYCLVTYRSRKSIFPGDVPEPHDLMGRRPGWTWGANARRAVNGCVQSFMHDYDGYILGPASAEQVSNQKESLVSVLLGRAIALGTGP